ncbi:PAS domain S-box protein [Desulfurivibrio alkaliphilus]|uniref:PAS domain S-box protein n=1 Tax=Desulfurivibrio alkaliphilus TaxID=427923 RepID=UPI0001B3F3E1|nr:PAS domain S-box protein [Desulfurivibrio alkaliphilus]
MLVSGGAFSPANLADRKHFQEARKRQDFAVGEFIIARVGYTDPAFAFAHPVFGPDDKLAAILTASVSLARFARVHDVVELPPGSFVAITDHQGIRLFYHPPREDTNPLGQPIAVRSWEIAREAAGPGIFVGKGSDGLRRIFAFKPVQLTDLEPPYAYVWAGVPEAIILQPANRVLLRNLLLLGLATVVSLAVAWLLSRKKLVRPITSLVDLSRQFADGRLDARLRSDHWPDEIATLARAFHDMAAELKASQQIMRENEARFRLLMNSLDAVVYVADMKTYEILFINETGRQLFGEVTGKLCWQSLHQDQAGPCSFCTNPLLLDEAGRPAGVYTWERQHADTGQWFYLRDQAIKWLDGRIVRLEVATDISQRKQAELALAEERERLAVTLKCIGDGVITTDTQSRVTMVNQVAESLTGWQAEEAVGRLLAEVFSLVDETSGEPVVDPVAEVLAQGRITTLEQRAVLRTRDGRELKVADSAAPIKNQAGEVIGVVLVFRDITQQLRTEQELMKIKKLESIGVLAGGLAHDFNNILTAILGNIQLALHDAEMPSQPRELLDQAAKASLRARQLTQQLLTFAKGGQPIREAASLPEVIRDSADFVLRGSKTACRYTIPADLWLVDIDKGQISQVIQNLILNASQAMPDGGVIEVVCENLPAARAAALALPAKGDYVKMMVKDRGVGIPAKVIDRIFDPYFTTKQLGNGLGLAICHSIISKHEGRITVSSLSGQGTTFEVFLPVAVHDAVVAGKSEVFRVGTRQARVLLMDDEEMIRQVGHAVLSKMGHEVELAVDGAESVAKYRAAKEQGVPFDLVIMDLTVPGGMGGQEAVKEILALDPEAKAVVASGYSHDPVMANYTDYGFQAALAKPFDLQELVRLLNKLLSRSRSPEPTSSQVNR